MHDGFVHKNLPELSSSSFTGCRMILNAGDRFSFFISPAICFASFYKGKNVQYVIINRSVASPKLVGGGGGGGVESPNDLDVFVFRRPFDLCNASPMC